MCWTSLNPWSYKSRRPKCLPAPFLPGSVASPPGAEWKRTRILSMAPSARRTESWEDILPQEPLPSDCPASWYGSLAGVPEQNYQPREPRVGSDPGARVGDGVASEVEVEQYRVGLCN